MYTIAAVAGICGTNSNYIRMQLHRKRFMFEDGDIITEATIGLPHQLSFDGAMRLALFLELERRGVKLDRVWNFISAFMDAGEFAYLGHVGGRDAGDFYPAGETVLVGYCDDENGRVVNIKPETTVWSVFEMGRPDAFMINISDIKRKLEASKER